MSEQYLYNSAVDEGARSSLAQSSSNPPTRVYQPTGYDTVARRDHNLVPTVHLPMSQEMRHTAVARLGLPITSAFALPLSIYYVLLQIRVTMHRIRTQTSLAQSSKSSADQDGNDPLLAAFRTQANFAENVPLALILAGLAEINGGDSTVLAATLCILTIGRVMHGEFGLMSKDAGGIGRPVGFFSTIGVIVGLASYGAWLSSKL